MNSKTRDYLVLLKLTFSDWNEDKAPRLAAALAYYMAFSLAPLLVIVIAVAGLVYGQDAAQNRIVGEISGLIGRQGAEQVQAMIAGASKVSSGVVATVLGIITLLFGASGVFGQLQDALNTIWEVRPKPGQGFIAMVRQRFFSFTMVLGTAFLLLVSLVMAAAVAAFSDILLGGIAWAEPLLQALNFLFSLLVTTLLFALIFKIVPDVEIHWRDVWIGAVFTALMFSLGRLALGLYLGQGSFGSSYGAAGSLVIIMLWIYYSAQILFFGAEFTQVYATRYGSHIEPSPNAEPVTEEARAQQGMKA